MTPNIFLRALGVIDERGWYQGDYEAADGRVCLVGALSVAVCGRPWTPEIDADGEEAVCAALARLKDRLVADGMPRHVADDIAGRWNDDPSTTEEDVRLLLKRAAVELEAEEAG